MRTLKILVALVMLLSTCSLYTYTYAEEVKQADAPQPERTLLMSGLDSAGIAKYLDKLGVKLYGYAQGGYMYDTTAPQPYAGATFLGYNNLRNTPILDKIALKMERTVDASKKQFDVGFCLEGIWGYDARFIHSTGLGDTQTGRYQLDPLQAYVDVALPYIPAKIRAGKWIELAGFEQFDANIYGAFGDPMRSFYSYSYQFMYAEPGTQTGVLGTYIFNPKLTVDLGFTEGWNHSTRNPNGDIDILGRVTYTPTDKTTIIFVMTEGPEFPIGTGRGLPEGDRSHWWTALDLVITHKVTDKLSLGLGTDFVDTPKIPASSDSSKQWGGIAGYISYALNQFLTLNFRSEWFVDSSDGFATGAGTRANFAENTLGLAIKPFPKDKILSNMIIRPEIRYDGSNKRVFNTANGNIGDKGELTMAGDILFTF